MRLKSFHGSNLNEAMALVREALGDQAIIVATRDDDMGGVRVTAAIEETVVQPSSPSDYFEEDREEGTDAIEIIAAAFLAHKVHPDLAERLLATATQFANDDPLLSLGAAFDTHFTFAPLSLPALQTTLTFVGPSGAGKTLSVAKFATKATLDKQKVTVASSDVERAGGIDQLSAFTNILNLPLMAIEDRHALQDVVRLHDGRGTLLLDTAGRNPFDKEEMLGLKDLVTAAGGETVLVLPANMDIDEALDMAKIFSEIGAKRLLLTRLDTTQRFGNLLRLAYDSKLPLANFSASSKVTEAPEAFNPVSLARFILPSKNAATKEQTSPSKATGTTAKIF